MQSTPELSTSTFGNEDALPRVPLPTPEESCALFLEWCAPLLTAEELRSTEEAVEEFLAPGSVARELHAALAEYDATPGVASWLDAFWDRRYLGRRDRIALNANFFFLLADSGQGQVERAAAMITTALAYKAEIDAETLPPALMRGRPVSMEQFKHLFSTTRIPGAVQDTVRTPYTPEWPGPSRERHVVVFVRGHALALDVLDGAGTPYSLDELAAGLRAALDAAPERARPGTSIGHLTTKARAGWAASREALIAAGNADALDVIERALFCVCLDDTTPGDELAASDQLLHGDSGNRWFDKAISLIVFADGTAGLNSEHCRLDGTTVIAFFDAVAEGSAVLRLGDPALHEVAQRTPDVVPITVSVDDDLRADVIAAGADFAEFAAGTATTTLSIDFSAERAKALGCSPDAFAQLALQLAHQRAKGMIGATYESIATRQFRGGRTEAMRVVTPHVVAFVGAMDPVTGRGAPAADKVAAARAAMDAQSARARECQIGHAPEQHLWELQLLQERRGGPAGHMALYDSPGWTIMRDDYLSTSAVPSPNVRFWGFGSTSQKCIGVGYAVLPDRFDMYLSTPMPVRAQMLDFARELPIAVAQLEELLAT